MDLYFFCAESCLNLGKALSVQNDVFITPAAGVGVLVWVFVVLLYFLHLC